MGISKSERANWYSATFIGRGPDFDNMLGWLSENTTQKFYTEYILKSIGRSKHAIAIFVKLESYEDYILYKLKWGEYE